VDGLAGAIPTGGNDETLDGAVVNVVSTASQINAGGPVATHKVRPTHGGTPWTTTEADQIN